MRAAALLFGGLAAGAAAALPLELPPGAELTREVVVEAGTRAIPTGPSDGSATPTHLASGAVAITAHRIPGNPAPARLLTPLAQALNAAGYETLLSCATESCGGFDFRFSLQLIPPPHMFVDLADFQVLSAVSPEGDRYVSIVASRSQSDGYLHIARVSPTAPQQITNAALPKTEPLPAGSLAAALTDQGHAALDDLEFASGSTELEEKVYGSLTELAAFLTENPTLSVALVGHTDATGALEMNIDLSRQRAAAARRLLLDRYSIPAERVRAEGMGYLAPRASNLTAEGREKNRRVEVIITSTRP